MPSKSSFDVVIVGSGAGGATVAQALAPSGRSILILERGEHLPRESDNWNPKAVFVERKYRTKEKWRDRAGRLFNPNTHYWVGGNTSFYGAALMRMKAKDFEETLHADGISPAWPIRYRDLAPYYERAEHLWRVRGERHIDPFDEPGDPPYPFPPLAHDPGIAALKTHFESLGWRPSPLPLGVNRQDEAPWASHCIRCKTCGGYPCLLKAKSDARSIALDPLALAPNVTLLDRRKAVRVETDAQGHRATAVLCEGPDGEERYSGDIIVLAAGAVNTAALMLGSANAAHPNGLANSSGQLGRNYMFHTTSAVLSLALEPFDVTFPKTLCVMDFYWGEPDGSYNYPMGQIQLLEYMSGQTLEGQIEDWIPAGLVPDLFANALADRMISFLAMSEDLPDPNNRVSISGDGEITLSYLPNNLASHGRLVKRLEHGLANFTAARHTLWEPHFQIDELLPIYGTAHQCGTARFGTDPASSVLDPLCKAHDLDNLYVTDSSFFVSSAAVNPTLTIVANALRVAEHIESRLAGR